MLEKDPGIAYPRKAAAANQHPDAGIGAIINLRLKGVNL